MNRKHISLMIALAVVLGLAAGSWAQDVSSIKFPKLNEIKIPDIQRVTLDNGMRLYILEDHSLPLVYATLRINVGSYLDPADQIGLASMTSGLLRSGGTAKWTADELDEMLEGVGASVETGMDIDQGSAFMSTLTEYTDMGLEVLAQVLRHPVFDQAKIDLAKTQARSGIARRNDDPYDMTRREWVKALYGPESPFARHIEYATIDAIERADLVAFHDQWYRPENIQMAVWGDFNSAEMLAKIKTYFDDWAKGSTPVPPVPEVPRKRTPAKVYVIDKPELKQATVRMGHLGGLVTDPDYAARLVANSITAGGFGSRIADVVRTKMGLAYSAMGREVSNYSYPGYFFIVVQTGNETAIKAAKAAIEQLESMKTVPPTEKEMGKGRDGYLNSFVFNFDSRGEVLNRFMTGDFYGLPEDFLQQEKQRVEQVTPQDVVNTAKSSQFADSLIIVISGNVAAFGEPVESLGYGAPDTIDVTIPSNEPKVELAVTDENLAKGSEIIAAVVKAHGGAANFKKITSIHSKATMTLMMGGQKLPVSVESVEVPPDKHRTIMTMMGQKMYDIRDGAKGWATGQTGALEESTPDALAEDDKDNARNVLKILQHAGQPYYQAVYVNTEDVYGAKADWVALLNEGGEEICRLAVDAATRQLVCQKYWGKSFIGEGMMERHFTAFKEVQGVKLPTVIDIHQNGEQIMKLETSELAFNGAVPADAFTKPEI